MIRPRIASPFELLARDGDLRRRSPETVEIEDETQPSPLPPTTATRRTDLAPVNLVAGQVVSWGEIAPPVPLGALRPPHPNPIATLSAPPTPAHSAASDTVPALASPRAPVTTDIADTASSAQHPVTSARPQQPKHDDAFPWPIPQPTAIIPAIRPAAQDALGVQRGATDREMQAARTARPSAAAGPTIQITIGRVEVRATTPQAAPAAARPMSPVMTLEEYVRRRRERGNS